MAPHRRAPRRTLEENARRRQQRRTESEEILQAPRPPDRRQHATPSRGTPLARRVQAAARPRSAPRRRAERRRADRQRRRRPAAQAARDAPAGTGGGFTRAGVVAGLYGAARAQEGPLKPIEPFDPDVCIHCGEPITYEESHLMMLDGARIHHECFARGLVGIRRSSARPVQLSRRERGGSPGNDPPPGSPGSGGALSGEEDRSPHPHGRPLKPMPAQRQSQTYRRQFRRWRQEFLAHQATPIIAIGVAQVDSQPKLVVTTHQGITTAQVEASLLAALAQIRGRRPR